MTPTKTALAEELAQVVAQGEPPGEPGPYATLGSNNKLLNLAAINQDARYDDPRLDSYGPHLFAEVDEQAYAVYLLTGVVNDDSMWTYQDASTATRMTVTRANGHEAKSWSDEDYAEMAETPCPGPAAGTAARFEPYIYETVRPEEQSEHDSGQGFFYHDKGTPCPEELVRWEHKARLDVPWLRHIVHLDGFNWTGARTENLRQQAAITVDPWRPEDGPLFADVLDPLPGHRPYVPPPVCAFCGEFSCDCADVIAAAEQPEPEHICHCGEPMVLGFDLAGGFGKSWVCPLCQAAGGGRWVMVTADKGVKTHFCEARLASALMADFRDRFGADPAWEETDGGFLDLPGMAMVNRPVSEIAVGAFADFTLRIPATDVPWFRDALASAEVRRFDNGEEYHKVHGWHACLVLTPLQRAAVLDRLADDAERHDAEAEEAHHPLAEAIRGMAAEGRLAVVEVEYEEGDVVLPPMLDVPEHHVPCDPAKATLVQARLSYLLDQGGLPTEWVWRAVDLVHACRPDTDWLDAAEEAVAEVEDGLYRNWQNHHDPDIPADPEWGAAEEVADPVVALAQAAAARLIGALTQNCPDGWEEEAQAWVDLYEPTAEWLEEADRLEAAWERIGPLTTGPADYKPGPLPENLVASEGKDRFSASGGEPPAPAEDPMVAEMERDLAEGNCLLCGAERAAVRNGACAHCLENPPTPPDDDTDPPSPPAPPPPSGGDGEPEAPSLAVGDRVLPAPHASWLAGRGSGVIAALNTDEADRDELPFMVRWNNGMTEACEADELVRDTSEPPARGREKDDAPRQPSYQSVPAEQRDAVVREAGLKVRVQLTSYFAGKYLSGNNDNYMLADLTAEQVADALQPLRDMALERYGKAKGAKRMRVQITEQAKKGSQYLKQTGDAARAFNVSVGGMTVEAGTLLVDYLLAAAFGERRRDATELAVAWRRFESTPLLATEGGPQKPEPPPAQGEAPTSTSGAPENAPNAVQPEETEAPSPEIAPADSVQRDGYNTPIPENTVQPSTYDPTREEVLEIAQRLRAAGHASFANVLVNSGGGPKREMYADALNMLDTLGEEVSQ